jgi:hypothetical protein
MDNSFSLIARDKHLVCLLYRLTFIYQVLLEYSTFLKLISSSNRLRLNKCIIFSPKIGCVFVTTISTALYTMDIIFGTNECGLLITDSLALGFYKYMWRLCF